MFSGDEEALFTQNVHYDFPRLTDLRARGDIKHILPFNDVLHWTNSKPLNLVGKSK